MGSDEKACLMKNSPQGKCPCAWGEGGKAPIHWQFLKYNMDKTMNIDTSLLSRNITI